MLLNELFQKIYVINLLRRRDRRIMIETKLNSMNISYEIVDAVDGNDPKYDSLCESILNRQGPWIKSRGAVGILLSFMKILQMAILKNYDNILVFEDDICFHKDFNKLLEKSKKNINFNEVDAIWLGANQYTYDDKQKKQLSDPECEYYTVSRLKWNYTFGAFALGLSKRLIQTLIKSIDLNTIIYAFDVHVFWVLAENNMIGRVLKPFLILPDVTDSDNMGVRDQYNFMKERLYNPTDYKYISIQKVNIFKKILDQNRISLRQLFSYKALGSHTIKQKEFCDKIDSLQNIDDSLKNELKDSGKTFFDCYSINQLLDIKYIFDSIEEKKTFVCIIPSYKNSNDYIINLNLIIKQIYPTYQYRVIYVDDNSKNEIQEINIDYIKKHKLANQFQCIRLDIKQHLDIARFIANHNCFDDEICLFIDNNKLVYNEMSFDLIDKHYTNNDIIVSCDSYYTHNMQNTDEKQQLKIPHNSKIQFKTIPRTITMLSKK